MDNSLVSDYCTHHLMGRGIRSYAVSPCRVHKDFTNSMVNCETFCRPRSMEGGDLRWFWSGFDMYERIDNVAAFLKDPSRSRSPFFRSIA